MVVLCLLLTLAAFLLTAALTWMLVRLGGRVGVMDQPGTEAHKRHERAVPSTGGMAMAAAIVLLLAGGICVAWLPASSWPGWLRPLAVHVEGLRKQTPMALAVLGALVVMHVTGVIDDRKRLGPFSKLAVQMLVAIALAVFFDMRVLQFLDKVVPWPGGVIISVTLSVLWLGVINNAMNFLDNMDGLAGGVGAIIAAIYLAATLIAGQWFVAALAALLLGALLGFLVFNFPPAKIFMGDGGSLVLGLLLGVISIRTTYFSEAWTEGSGGASGGGNNFAVLMPLVIMAVPLYDFTSVTVIRLLHGKSPFVGDRNHFSHRLVRRGLSKRNAVLLVWMCTLATGLGGAMLGTLQGWQALLVGAQTIAVLAVLAMLESAGESTIEMKP